MAPSPSLAFAIVLALAPVACARHLKDFALAESQQGIQTMAVSSLNQVGVGIDKTAAAEVAVPEGCSADLMRGPKRSDFPEGFIFGAATSAYQVEGAADEDGRGPSIWDTFVRLPYHIMDGSSGTTADDEYHHVDEDVALLKNMGMDSYRFSISWSRVLPEGAGTPNEAGIAYYNTLIDALLKAGIQPAVTLYHWDLPQALQDAYGGFLSPRVVEDFAAYASLCFARFGDRVKTWITFNEPMEVTIQGFAAGGMAPGRCSNRDWCREGNAKTEPYIAAKNLLMAHAAAVHAYWDNFKETQGGRIGITLDCTYLYPMDPNNPDDVAAADLGMQMMFGWFAHPVVHGQFPDSMMGRVGERLQAFSKDEGDFIVGTADFLGLNAYTANYARAGEGSGPYMDGQVYTSSFDLNNNSIGASTGSDWLKVVPESIMLLLQWVHKNYPQYPIMITENGVSQGGGVSKEELLCDTQRVQFYQDYLSHVAKAIQSGVPVQGYYAWSLLDNFEWAAGYTQRFGLHYVDYDDPTRPRIPKASAAWWSQMLRN